MPGGKRKAPIEDFDHNKSDSNDTDFDPESSRPARPSKKARKSTGRSKSAAKSGKKKSRYRGSDVDDDDDEIDSDEEVSEGDESEEIERDETTGRPVRAAKRKGPTYEESSDEDSEEAELTEDSEPETSRRGGGRNNRHAMSKIDDDDDEDDSVASPVKRKSMIIKLRLPAETPRRTTRGTSVKARGSAVPRSTRAGSAVTRATRSRSHEPLATGLPPTVRKPRNQSVVDLDEDDEDASNRNTRGGKGLQVASTIKEEIHETSSYEDPAQADVTMGTEIAGTDDQDDHIDRSPEPAAQVVEQGEEQSEAQIEGDVEQQPAVDSIEIDDGGDESEDGPIARRPTRAARQDNASGSAEAEASGGGENAGTRRSTRGLRAARKKGGDKDDNFNPDESASDDNMSASESPKKKRNSNSEDDEFSSGTNKRKRKSARKSQRNSQRQEGSGSEDIDSDEVADELSDLVKPSRRRKPHQLNRDGIVYEDNKRSTRGKNNINYAVPSMQEVIRADEAEVDDAAPEPSGRGRGGRGGATSAWDRTLYTTFGPHGGAVLPGQVPVFGGPWGTGAAGGVESDSSDDEGMQRPHNAGGNVGMTPTSAFPPGLLPGLGQTNNPEPPGAPNVGKVKSQKALADADPLGVDQNVDFSKIGGLDGHIDQLKEMVMMPLLYPELFQKFKVVPPRGVLFHGPPGTGKTLLARALAASVGTGGKKVTFYMRKGADALSKWVGEAERQLRLLFEEARKTQPSIIFFDEIDGLAPVRSSKQEQIHASIVSTLLALMDGMDGRGQVIVIGATNRPDNIDPALRRPGRFDREFYFPLPGLDARKSIIDINTKDWEIDNAFKNNLAELTKGYGGADLRALCTEAALNSIQRTYPQIYSSNDKLLIDSSKIKVNAKDFMLSIKKIIPSSERSTSSGAAPVPKVVEPLLRAPLNKITTILDALIPMKKKITALEEAMFEQYDDADLGFAREQMQQEFERSRVFRPRLLICGETGMGQQYLGGAILNHFEGLHVQSFDLPTIYSDSARSPETAIVQLFAEVKRHKPSVIYIPAVDIWYSTLPVNVITTFLGLLKSIPPNDPVMVLGITDTPANKLEPGLMRDLFGFSKHNHFTIERPTRANREEFFQPIISYARKCPKDFPEPLNRKKRKLEQLPLAPIIPPPPPSKKEIRELKEKDNITLNLLKITLQPVMDQIKRKYKKYRLSVIPSYALQYLRNEKDPLFVRADVEQGVEIRPYELAKDSRGRDCIRETATGKLYYNMDFAIIEERLSNGFYARLQDFAADIKTLKADAMTLGDEERILKMNELYANVVVDMGTFAAIPGLSDCENLYRRQHERARRREEKYEELLKKKEQENVAASDEGLQINSDMPMGSSDTEFILGVPFHSGRDLFTTPKFAPSGLSNGHSHTGTGISNGASVPAHSEDTQMTGADDGAVHDSPMYPPNRAPTSGLDTQVSQRSAWHELSHGTSPSQLINDASTTTSGNKTSDKWSTQATNGTGTHNSSPLDRPPQDPANSQGNTQETSSEEWAHSQAHGLARGILRNSNPSQTTSSGSQYSQPPAAPPYPAPPRLAAPSRPSGFANLLNEMPPPEPTSSQLSSQKDQIVDEAFITDLLRHLVDGSSGCSVEQLEQVYRELMDTLWSLRGEWNRSLVTARLVKVFNTTIHDIEDIQKVLQASQSLEGEYVVPGLS